jgi:hypothetical protein
MLGIWLLLASLGCRDKSEPPTSSPVETTDTGAPGGDSDEPGDDTGEAPEPPCSGCLADAAALFVCAGGDDAGEGSLDDPFASLGAAIAASRGADAPGQIFIDAGTYDAGVALDAGDGGLQIEGCGSAQTSLAAGDGDNAAVELAGAAGVRLAGLTLLGGARGLLLWDSASAEVQDLVIDGGPNVGVLLDSGSGLIASDMHLLDPVADTAGDFGYGLVAQGGSTVYMDSGEVQGANTVGVLALGPGTLIELVGVEISDTSTDAGGAFGRGVMVQDGASASLTDSAVYDSADAGVFAAGAAALALDGCTVDQVATSLDPDSGEETGGDGVVALGAGGGSAASSATSSTVSLTDTTLSNTARAGAVLEGVTVVALSEVSLEENGYTVDDASIFLQGGTTYKDGEAPGVYEDEGSTLGVNEEPLPEVSRVAVEPTLYKGDVDAEGVLDFGYGTVSGPCEGEVFLYLAADGGFAGDGACPVELSGYEYDIAFTFTGELEGNTASGTMTLDDGGETSAITGTQGKSGAIVISFDITWSLPEGELRVHGQLITNPQ